MLNQSSIVNHKEKKAWIFDALMAKINKPNLKKKTNFYRLFSVSQKAWLWMIDSLRALLDSETNRGMRSIIQDLISQLIQWVDLAHAMQRHEYFFGIDEVELVRSSQVVWNLVDTLNDIADNLEQSNEISWRLRKALTYPLILLIWSIVAALFIDIKVLPNIAVLFPNTSDLPKVTLVMMDIADFMISYWAYICAWLLSIVVILFYLYKKFLPFKIFVDNMVLGLPAISPVIKWKYQYKFARQMSQFYSAWMSPIISLQLIANIFSNYMYKRKVLELKKDMEAWFSIFEWMEWSALFDPILAQIIHVWETTWTTKTVLAKISEFYKLQLETKIDIMMQLLEPILMIFIAIIIGSIVAAIMLPMASVMQTI